jgi:anti-sigma factor RsiW
VDCRTYEDLLDALLDGRLSESERKALEAHAAGCPRCSEMLSLVTMELGDVEVPAPEGLAEAVLQRTSGSPCGRARELLCDLVDRTLQEADAELVRIHLDGCAECRSTAAALARLREDLPLLAEIRPGERFVEGVLSRTSRGWRWRLEERLRLLLARPRLAAEGAYLGSFFFMVLVAVPGAPLRGLPGGALQATRSELTERVVASAKPIADLGPRVAALESSAREKLNEGSDALRELRDRADRFIESLRGEEDRTNDEPTIPAREGETKETRP